MEKVKCPVCGATCEGGEHIGDDTLFLCPKCGDYRLADTTIVLFENGTLMKPDPRSFRDLVKRKRGSSTAYPVVTHYDLGG